MLYPNTSLVKKLNYLGFFLVLVLMIRFGIVGWIRYGGTQMYPTLPPSKKAVFVNLLAYDVKMPLTNKILFSRANPKRGDVVLAQFPDRPKDFYRVIGLPGDSIGYVQSRIFLNGQVLPMSEYPEEKEILTAYSGPIYPGSKRDQDLTVKNETLDGITYGTLFEKAYSTDFDTVRIPMDSYYLIQDNRIVNNDSRYFGPISKALILGKLFN
jgi:signal peptidase I